MYDSKLIKYKIMRVAIVGYGIEGETSYKYFSADKSNKIYIVDESCPKKPLPLDVNTIIGPDAFNKLKDFDLVVRSPGISPRKINTKGKIWSATNEFFVKCPCMIIGITGSKGKGTTASLVASILRKDGYTVWLLGNIGEPSLKVLHLIKPDDIVVYELSSFQLWDIEKSPQRAAILFIEKEHLDVHADMNEYLEAKARITKYQTSRDMLVFNQNNEYARRISVQSKAQLFPYPDKKTCHIENDSFCYGQGIICSVEYLNIVGEHNVENACAAINLVWDLIRDKKSISRGLISFRGLSHRLQFVREINSVEYYDDSIATTPCSAIAALNSFKDKQVVIILGGSSKNADFSELAFVLKNSFNAYAILIGQEAERIAQSFKQNNFTNFEIVPSSSMDKIVEIAYKNSTPNGVVLLSPACASFGMFKDYIDRGNQFQKAVSKLSIMY